MENIKQWIENHDESNVFLFIYITAAVVLSIAISLFWLVVVVFVHFIFECIKQDAIKSGWQGVLLRSCWELLLDFALIIFAFVIAIYMDIILGAAGIGAGARAGVQSASKAGARFAGWQRALRGFLLSLDDVAQLTKLSKEPEEKEKVTKYGGWTNKWSKGDKITFLFTIISTVLVLAAPILTSHSFTEVFAIIIEDLQPFPK